MGWHIGRRDARALLGTVLFGLKLLGTSLTAGCPAEFLVRVDETDAGAAEKDAGFTLPDVPDSCLSEPQSPTSISGTTVGDGGSASCTASALQAALDRGGWIRFNCGGSSTVVPIESPLSVRQSGTRLDGGGRITLSGQGSSRVLQVHEGAAPVTLVGLSITSGSGDRGAGIQIHQNATVWLDQVALTSNVATGETAAGAQPRNGGGAIHIAPGARLVGLNTNFLNNRASFGGALWNQGETILFGGRLTSNLTLEEGLEQGGGISATGGSLRMCQVRVENNSAAEGGAIFVDGGALRAERTHFVNNTASGSVSQTGSGGAIRGMGSELSLSRCSFEGNISADSGGALALSGGASSIQNTSFIANAASGGSGGALYIDEGDHRLVHNTMFGGSSRNGGSELAGSGLVTLYGNLLVGGDSVCGDTYQGDGVLQSPGIPCVPSAIQDDGLQLKMLAVECDHLEGRVPSADSAAIDQAAASTCPEFDMCGAVRDRDACDLGAVERP
ncbi:MAG: choice-of-anchor Q domain-containing protein [Myxococcota bacterium]